MNKYTKFSFSNGFNNGGNVGQDELLERTPYRKSKNRFGAFRNLDEKDQLIVNNQATNTGYHGEMMNDRIREMTNDHRIHEMTNDHRFRKMMNNRIRKPDAIDHTDDRTYSNASYLNRLAKRYITQSSKIHQIYLSNEDNRPSLDRIHRVDRISKTHQTRKSHQKKAYKSRLTTYSQVLILGSGNFKFNRWMKMNYFAFSLIDEMSFL